MIFQDLENKVFDALEINSNERENNQTSENTKTNENNLQSILEHNKHDYINEDPKTNNHNQKQLTSKNTCKTETNNKQINDKIKEIISVSTNLMET